MHKDTTIAHLSKVMQLKLGGIQIAVMDPKDLTIDMMVDEVRPAARADKTDLSGQNGYGPYGVKLLQLPARYAGLLHDQGYRR